MQFSRFYNYVLFTESGYYVPKGYYVIHADGHQSEVSKISPSHVSFNWPLCLFALLLLTFCIIKQELLLHTLRRRRSAQFASSSSSSSSSFSSNGGPVSFHHSSSSNISPAGIFKLSFLLQDFCKVFIVFLC